MTTILLGMGLLLLTLAGFSLFSLKAPKGSVAMSGLANAAVATFLVEAVLKYIFGDLFGIAFFGEVGGISGSMGGVAAAILVPIAMGANPVFAVVGGVAVGGYGILPGFLAGYVIGFLSPLVEKYLPNGSCGVIAFGLKGDRETAVRFMDSLDMINIVTHVADARTCVLHPASHTHRQLSDEQLREAGVAPDLIRLSVGIEDVEDILDDIRQALDKI